MKKLSILLSGLFLLLMSSGTMAQPKTGASYFEGKWNILVKGTPNGDAKMVFVLENKPEGMSGVVQDSTGTELSKIPKVDLTDTEATIYCTLQGYDLSFIMAIKDEDHITGKLMQMFEVEGDRIKATTKLR